MPVQLECDIHAAGSFELGHPVRVTGTLRNTGPNAVWVLRWNTFLDGMRGDFLTLTRSGQVLRYEGIRILRRDARQQSYVRIPAGGSVSGEVDASRAYPIDRAGDMTATFHLNIQDAFEEGQAQAPRHPASRQHVEVRSAETILRIVPGGRPLPTQGAEAMARTANIGSGTPDAGVTGSNKPKAPGFNGGTSEQHIQVLAAHDWAYEAILESILGLQRWDTTDQMRYKLWFGLFGTENQETVLANFQTMQRYMAGTKVTYDFTDPEGGCSWDTYAYTHIYPAPYQCPFIYLCDLFFSWFTSEEDQAETVVHEVSHAATKVGDVVYSQIGAAGLAQFNPSAAIDNAENYAFFSTAYVDEPSTGNGVWQSKGQLHDHTNSRPAVAVDQSNGLLIDTYQGTNGKLYVRAYDIQRNSWKSEASVTNPANKRPCLPKYGPAIAWVGGTFFIVYLDADSASPTSGQLVCIASSDDGATWSAPQAVLASGLTTSCSAALATMNGLLYCAYSDANWNLQCVTGTPDSAVVAWAQPASVGYVIANEPGLGVFNGQLYLMFVDAGQPQYSQSLSLVTSSDGASWSDVGRFPDYPATTGPALAAWGSNLLMCLHTGAAGDNRIRYATYTWNPQANQGSWEATEWITKLSSTNGPAMAAYDASGILFGFNKGNSSSHIYWFTATQSALARAALRSTADGAKAS